MVKILYGIKIESEISDSDFLLLKLWIFLI